MPPPRRSRAAPVPSRAPPAKTAGIGNPRLPTASTNPVAGGTFANPCPKAIIRPTATRIAAKPRSARIEFGSSPAMSIERICGEPPWERSIVTDSRHLRGAFSQARCRMTRLILGSGREAFHQARKVEAEADPAIKGQGHAPCRPALTTLKAPIPPQGVFYHANFRRSRLGIPAL